MLYADLGPDYYERQADTRRQIAHHVGKLGALGSEVTLCRLPEPGQGGSGSTPGRVTARHSTRRTSEPAPLAMRRAQPRSYFRVREKEL